MSRHRGPQTSFLHDAIVLFFDRAKASPSFGVVGTTSAPCHSFAGEKVSDISWPTPPELEPRAPFAPVQASRSAHLVHA